MKWWIAFSLCWLVAPGLRAEWALRDTSQREATGGVIHLEKRVEDLTSGRSVTLQIVLFDARKHTMRVIDRDSPDGRTLATAMKEHQLLAGVNGGYFHPDFRPSGMVVSGGEVINKPERARLLSGVLAITRDRLHLFRSNEYKLGANTREGLQAGPFLVDRGRAVDGLNASRAARRTFIATDGKHGWMIGVISPVTLADAGTLLSTRAVLPELRVDRALNLDGGSSTGLWVRSPGSDFYQREFTQVRNFIGIAPR